MYICVWFDSYTSKDDDLASKCVVWNSKIEVRNNKTCCIEVSSVNTSIGGTSDKFGLYQIKVLKPILT